jgi:hypothetical protein
MFITPLNHVLSVCTWYETLPQDLANRFSRILNVVTKTWYKKRNSMLEYYAFPSYDVTSAGSDNSNNNWTTEEEYVDSRHRQDIVLLSKASRRLCDTHWTYYTIWQLVPGQTDGLFSLNLQMVTEVEEAAVLQWCLSLDSDSCWKTVQSLWLQVLCDL